MKFFNKIINTKVLIRIIILLKVANFLLINLIKKNEKYLVKTKKKFIDYTKKK